MADEVSTDEYLRIYRQVLRGVKPPKDEAPELAEVRRRLTEQVREIEKKGGVGEIPYDG